MKFTLLIVLAVLGVKYPPPDIYNYKYVQDLAGIIDNINEVKINDLCWEVDKQTTVQMAVLTIDSTGGEDIGMLAVEVGEEWGVGREDIDNGLLLVVSLGDRKYFTATGYGMEPIITDAKAGQIQRQVLVPNFKQGNYGEGIFQTLQMYAAEIEEYYEVEFVGTEGAPKLKKSSGFSFGACLPFLLPFIFLILMTVLNAFIRKRGGGTGFWSSGGGFSSGGGGFSGGSFGGGSFGGGGAGGGW